MALINCKECGAPVSTTAQKCQKCGAPTQQQTKRQIVGFVVAVVLVLGLIAYFQRPAWMGFKQETFLDQMQQVIEEAKKN